MAGPFSCTVLLSNEMPYFLQSWKMQYDSISLIYRYFPFFSLTWHSQWLTPKMLHHHWFPSLTSAPVRTPARVSRELKVLHKLQLHSISSPFSNANALMVSSGGSVRSWMTFARLQQDHHVILWWIAPTLPPISFVDRALMVTKEREKIVQVEIWWSLRHHLHEFFNNIIRILSRLHQEISNSGTSMNLYDDKCRYSTIHRTKKEL